jgi:hypothetical protein
MFPDALFVFALRAPWPTIRSAKRKSNKSYIVPTEFVNNLPNDLIFRAAGTWAEAIEVLMRERDANWIVVRYEELVARPHAVICELYNYTGLTHGSAVAHAARLPEPRVRDFSFLKYQMMGHPYQAEIFALLRERAKMSGYDTNLAALPGSAIQYAVRRWLSPWELKKRLQNEVLLAAPT